MKTLFPLLLLIATTGILSAQAPQALSYSAVARDNNGTPLANQSIAIQFSILKGSTVGAVQYQENHFTATNEFGVFTLAIGTGNVIQGGMAAINWGNDSYYLKVGLDATGATNFQTMGTTQFLSVPYALYAERSGNAVDGDTSVTNELQSLSISGDTIKLSGSNSVVLPQAQLPSPSFTAKINGVDITDPSLDYVMIAPFIFLTPTGYRFDLDYSQSAHPSNAFGYMSDTTALGVYDYGIMFSGQSCGGSVYVKSYGYNSIGKGRIFSVGNTVYYVPINATPVQVNYQSVNTGGCSNASGSEMGYQVYPNNPAVTGYSFPAGRMALTFER